MPSLDFTPKRHCYLCNGTKTKLNSKGAENWYHTHGKDKPMCNRCYARLIESPKRRAKKEYRDKQKVYNARTTSHRFRYPGLGQAVSSFDQRSGYCSLCPNNIFDGTCKKTNMHHRIYIRCFPWFGREERCVSCHNKTKQRGHHGYFIS